MIASTLQACRVLLRVGAPCSSHSVGRMVSADLVDNGKWDEIEVLAREAMAGKQ